jgi:hypothetical protein
VVAWLSGFAKPLSRLGLCRYEEYAKGQPLKILLVGYNGARNTGADARVVALPQQRRQESAPVQHVRSRLLLGIGAVEHVVVEEIWHQCRGKNQL